MAFHHNTVMKEIYGNTIINLILAINFICSNLKLFNILYIKSRKIARIIYHYDCDYRETTLKNRITSSTQSRHHHNNAYKNKSWGRRRGRRI